MGLFSKKDPCAICGGKVKGLFPSKIAGQYICSDCYGATDLPEGATDNMSVEDFRAYMAFRDENAQLKQQFQITQEVDFGWFDTKFVFDAGNRLMCLDKSLEKTIFEGGQIKSFVIKEDSTPIFEGSAAGLVCYSSTVPERAQAMMPQIQSVRIQMELYEAARRMMDDDDNSVRRPVVDLPEPFRSFNVEIRFEHPYWDVFTADKEGPRFDNDMPDLDDYLDGYKRDFAVIEQLARALKQVAFPDAPEQTVHGGVTVGAAVTAAAAPVDTVAEIKRFKDLLEQGVITEEEFAAKKRQLLGI